MYELKKSLDLFKKGFGLWTTRAKVHQSNWIHFFIHQVLRTLMHLRIQAPSLGPHVDSWVLHENPRRAEQHNSMSRANWFPQIAYLYSATIPLVLEISSVLAAWNKMLPSMGEGVWLCVRCRCSAINLQLCVKHFQGRKGPNSKKQFLRVSRSTWMNVRKSLKVNNECEQGGHNQVRSS